MTMRASKKYKTDINSKHSAISVILIRDNIVAHDFLNWIKKIFKILIWFYYVSISRVIF